MITKTKVLKFTKDNWRAPVICELVRNFDITFSILKAKILPKQAGILVLEITGAAEEFPKITSYLEKANVTVESIEHDIFWDKNICSQCGACAGFCPSQALYVKDRNTMEIAFDAEKCIGCKFCLIACPSRALKMDQYFNI